MNMKRLLVLMCICTLLIQGASATITITPVDVGCTYIKWDWGSGLTITEMYFDGNVMCGYDTEAQNITFTDLNPGELHTLQLLTAGDSGTNATYTNATETCAGTGETVYVSPVTQGSNDIGMVTIAFVGLIGLLIVFALFVARR
jgi:hypothetical protein